MRRTSLRSKKSGIGSVGSNDTPTRPPRLKKARSCYKTGLSSRWHPTTSHRCMHLFSIMAARNQLESGLHFAIHASGKAGGLDVRTAEWCVQEGGRLKQAWSVCATDRRSEWIEGRNGLVKRWPVFTCRRQQDDTGPRIPLCSRREVSWQQPIRSP